MTLVLEYRNTRADLLAHYRLASADAFRSARSAHYNSLAFWSVLLLLTSYAAFRADQVYLMCAVVLLGGWSLIRSLPFSRRYWASVEESLSTRPETRIRLEVREDGLHETEDGIQSFVPWSSVKSFTILGDRLFVELSASLWAIIPRGSVNTDPNAVDELIKTLRGRGIKEAARQAA
jgi:hypothetical protein